jgi:aspartate ammonia-lyase
MGTERIEADLIGSLPIPRNVLYGVHTRRAELNFDVSGLRLKDFPELIQSMAMVKKAAALANAELGLLPVEKASAISEACDDLIELKGVDENFPIDMMQGGAGTSTNMNVNEVVTNLALLKLGANVGDYAKLHPNDDVNLSQSTNDVYPTEAIVPLRNKTAELRIGLHPPFGGSRLLLGQKAKYILAGKDNLFLPLRRHLV